MNWFWFLKKCLTARVAKSLRKGRNTFSIDEKVFNNSTSKKN